jgi:hypothetical protein
VLWCFKKSLGAWRRKKPTNACLWAKIGVRSHALAKEGECALFFRDLAFKR